MNIVAKRVGNPIQKYLAAIVIICGILLVFLFPNQCSAETTTGEWVFGSSLREARYRHTATLLTDGRVLVVGGQDANGDVLSTAEIFDPTSGTWRSTPSLRVARTSHTATLLDDSRVLVAGGYSGTDAIAGAEIYDPDTNSWMQVASLRIPRSKHSATLLTDGRVLVAGGRGDEVYLTSAEVYNPTFGTWSTTDSMATARNRHAAVSLPSSGHVLVTGGTNDSGSLSSTEKYVPETGSWVQLDPMLSARGLHTANTLPSGEVIVTGGLPPDYPESTSNPQSTVELFDLETNRWSFRAPMVYPRQLHPGVIMQNGQLLIAGGYGIDASGDGALDSVATYDNARNVWTTAPSLLVRHQDHTATLLQDGRVLVVGGRGIDRTAMKTVELYIEQVECYRLTISVIGNGTLSANPSHSNGCGSGYYAAGTVVALTANPSSGWRVGRWEGTNNDSNTNLSNSVTMPAGNHTVRVIFEEVPPCYYLSLTHSGSGADPIANPSRSDSCSTGYYEAGQAVTVSANPSSGWRVGRWEGTNNDSSTSLSNSVTMPARNHDVSVTYVPICYQLSLSHTGSGSDPVATSANSDGCSNGEYVSGANVTLTADPVSGWRVAGWSGTSNDAGTASSNSFTMPARNHSVSVTYEEQQESSSTTYFPFASYHLPPPIPFPTLYNGSFDLVGESGWQQQTNSPSGDGHDLIVSEDAVTGINAHTPPNLVWLGGTPGVTDNLHQQVVLPTKYPTVQLSYRYWIKSAEHACEADLFRLRIFTIDTGEYHSVNRTSLCTDTQTSGWQQMVIPLGVFVGREIRIHFVVVLDNESDVSNFYLDSVKLCDGSSQHQCD